MKPIIASSGFEAERKPGGGHRRQLRIADESTGGPAKMTPCGQKTRTYWQVI